MHHVAVDTAAGRVDRKDADALDRDHERRAIDRLLARRALHVRQRFEGLRCSVHFVSSIKSVPHRNCRSNTNPRPVDEQSVRLELLLAVWALARLARVLAVDVVRHRLVPVKRECRRADRRVLVARVIAVPVEDPCAAY